MFTGLIQTTATLLSRHRAGEAGKLSVRCARSLDAPQYGESIAVNGACLTLERADADGTLHFHTLAETLERTNLGRLPIGAKLNIERALQLGDRIGGHLMTGHIDATAPVRDCRRLGAGDFEVTVELPEAYAPLVVEKGSIGIDGISLTVASAGNGFFTVRLIPVTLADTALEARKPGSLVNLETDLLGKYVFHQLSAGRDGGGPESGGAITMETLHQAGFL